ncbi:MAG: Fe-S-cluster-containing hydrogenase [Bacteroidales bacterium]|nr:Fe-S-cluster-containing hydrogenase [Bacteroidales bacterium]
MKKYWRSPEELKYGLNSETERDVEINHKNAVIDLFENDLPEKTTSRRDFLKLMGFSITTATIVASCEKPVSKAIPYLIKPEEITPGNASYYASSFFDGNEYGSILVKTRDGRPIKIEGNDLSKISRGKTSARIQASVLSLYDDARYKFPQKGGAEIGWEQIDKEINGKLNEIAGSGKKVVLLTGTVISPSTIHAIEILKEKYTSLEWIQYDAVSNSGMLQANFKAFGEKAIPDYKFKKADLVVSFSADFLGTWVSPVSFTRAYSKRRNLTSPDMKMSKHIHFEAGMSLTGSNADIRYPVKPSEEGLIIGNIYNGIAEKLGEAKIKVDSSPFDVHELVTELLKNRGKSIVVSGSAEVNIQLLVNKINFMLGNYGETIDIKKPLYVKKGIDSDISKCVEEMNQGLVGGIIIHNVNPVYDYYENKKFNSGLAKIDLKVSLSSVPTETSYACEYVCPDHHYLESWNDAEPKKGKFSLAQPAIRPIYNTRNAQESLLNWAGNNTDFLSFIQAYWKENMFNSQDEYITFQEFWNHSLQKGVFDLSAENENEESIAWISENDTLGDLSSKSEGLELVMYETVALRDGKDGNNPWLQEMPDPITKACWDNYLSISPTFAEDKGFQNEDVVTIAGIEVPVFVQPGQAKGTVSLALGYGRSNTGKVADGVGVNAFGLIQVRGNTRSNYRSGIEVEKTNKTYNLALTQTHNSMEERPIVRETTLGEYLKNPNAGNEMHLEAEKHNVSLYKDVKFDGHHWGMAINLNSCTACGACIIACQAENNVPVVGKEEVRRRRILHWIRIDRYYSDEPDQPTVLNQPVMCQHCDNAPCENVCPVSATMHSSEGLNQIAYNRCIGTKYCINNCPYRVRRFNWFKYANNDKFDYNQNSDLAKLVLNPDVVVRERGVVEKCTFCVQRIQDKKLEAKLEKRPLRDGEIQTACVQTCPADALVFGDLNDKNSGVSKLFNNERNYFLLEELHILPSVGYLTKVRNIERNMVEDDHGTHF